MKPNDKGCQRRHAAGRFSTKDSSARRPLTPLKRRLRSQVNCLVLKESVSAMGEELCALTNLPNQTPINAERALRLGLPQLRQRSEPRLRVLIGKKA